MERLLQYVWKHRLFPPEGLTTTDGTEVEVIDQGLENTDAGPDFFNSKVRIGKTMWAGNVEIHLRTSDWFRHHHDVDPVYNSIILHVARDVDAELERDDGSPIPQMQMDCPDEIRQNYAELIQTDHRPPCYNTIRALPRLTILDWLDYLRVDRLEDKVERVENTVKMVGGDWDAAFFITLARGFGFGLNGDMFERWARNIPLRKAARIYDRLDLLEALFFGQAGILEDETGDEYYMALKREYDYMCRKYELMPLDGCGWSFFRLRPPNFPHIRIAQLACLFHVAPRIFSVLMEAADIDCLRSLLRVGTSAYWNTHYAFGGVTKSRTKTLSDSSLDILIINVIIPYMYAWGKYRGRDELFDRASDLAEKIKPEHNYITRMWEACGIFAQHSGDSQALIQLKKEYCDKRKCIYCRIGHTYLNRKVK